MSLGLRSGDVAAAAGVNRQTLRYYERRGGWQSRTEPRRASGLSARDRHHAPCDQGGSAPGLHARRGRRIVGRRPPSSSSSSASALEEAGLAARAQLKLAEVEAKINDLQAIADTLRAAIDAGCDDLVECAGNACCPIPFASIAENSSPSPQPWSSGAQ